MVEVPRNVSEIIVEQNSCMETETDNSDGRMDRETDGQADRQSHEWTGRLWGSHQM